MLHLFQLVPDALAHDYSSCLGSLSMQKNGVCSCCSGRVFPPVLSTRCMSPGFHQAPSGSSITLCFAFTHGAKDLVALHQDIANEALRMLRFAVRHVLRTSGHGGYECQEDEGAFMLAFAEMSDVVVFAAAL